MNSLSSGAQVEEQVRSILQDDSMFAFLCERSFETCDTHRVGAVTLDTVAPFIQNMLRSLGRPMTTDSIYNLWQSHADPAMRHMTREHFASFLRSVFEEQLRECPSTSCQPLAHYEGSKTQHCLDPSSTTSAGHASLQDEHVQDHAALGRQVGRHSEAQLPAYAGSDVDLAGTTGLPDATCCDLDDACGDDNTSLTDALIGVDAATIRPEYPGSKVSQAFSEISDDVFTDWYARLPLAAKETRRCALASVLSMDDAAGQFDGRCTVVTSLDAALRCAHRMAADELFEDPEFGPNSGDPHGHSALNRGDALEDICLDVCWLRPAQLGIPVLGQLGAIQAGIFGDEWFTSALGVIALHERLLFGCASGQEPRGVFPRLFWDQDLRRIGLYCFRFWKYDRWLYVLIDDRLPCAAGTCKLLGAQAQGMNGQTTAWAALIEKAYAKLHGGYSALWKGFFDDAITDMSSLPVEKFQTLKYARVTGIDAPKDSAPFWKCLTSEFEAGASIACLRMETVVGDEQFIHADVRFLHAESELLSADATEIASTGILRRLAYCVIAMHRLDLDGKSVNLVRLRDAAGPGLVPGTGWRGRWADGSKEWPMASSDSELLSKSLCAADGQLLSHCGLQPSADQPCLRPHVAIGSQVVASHGLHDGTFVMSFEDWLQVFSHVFVARPLAETGMWSSRFLSGRWTTDTCGGTPIPAKRPVLSTPEQWAKNPQCRFVFNNHEEFPDGYVEVLVLLQQHDARMHEGSPFPFDDRLFELFLCISRLDNPQQRLRAFEKHRIVREGGVTPISRRREVLLRCRLAAPGAYAVVPSTWETNLVGRDDLPFRLSFYARCSLEAFDIVTDENEGWGQPVCG